jgi:hypothetical protein
MAYFNASIHFTHYYSIKLLLQVNATVFFVSLQILAIIHAISSILLDQKISDSVPDQLEIYSYGICNITFSTWFNQ